MRIHCDACGAEISKEEALAREYDRQVLYFCSDKCMNDHEHHELMQDPGPDEDQSSAAP